MTAAGARSDLPYLRRRIRPKAPAPAAAPPKAAGSTTNPALADFLSGRGSRPGRAPAPTPAPAAPAPPPPAQPGGSSLDLGDSSASEPPAPTSSGGTSLSLDLGGGDDAPQAPAGASQQGGHTRHIREEQHDLRLPTIAAGERRVLGVQEHVVHLTRMQSAAGRLEITPAVASGEQLALGCALETSDRQEAIVLPALNRQGPDPRRPVVRCGAQGVEIDLRRVRILSRLLVLAVTPRLPGGTLVVRTYGDSRMEIPLPTAATLGAQALLTAYVVQGRLVLRAELDPFSGTLQQVCGAYGYTDLTWRDPATPLV